MDTLILKAKDSRASLERVRALGPLLARGGVVAFPTETVYGLGVLRQHEEARARLAALKGRDPAKPFTVHLPDRRRIEDLAAPLPPVARRLADRLWPGPLTLVLRDRDGGWTGFRLPDSAVARALAAGAPGVLVATSANLSGTAPLVRAADVVRAFRGRVEAIVTAGTTPLRAASTVVRVTDRSREVLREGALPAAEVLRAACVSVLFVCTGNLCRSPMAEGILKARLAERLGVAVDELAGAGYRVESAGTANITGEPATPAARRSALRHGADISGHRSQPLTPSLVESADRIYVAAEHHARAIREFVPEAADRIRTILPDGADLPDPYQRTEAHYIRAADEIRAAVQAILEDLLAR